MSFDHAYGAVLGAFVGDAAGAVLEFRGKPGLDEVGAGPRCRVAFLAV